MVFDFWVFVLREEIRGRGRELYACVGVGAFERERLIHCANS